MPEPDVPSGPRPILRVGLTGGIASGKSTVAGFFREWGAFLVDADRVAHEILEPGGSAHDAVVARFGSGILDPHGRVDRAALGRLVFADPEALRALNDRVHPRVREEIDRRIEEHRASGRALVAVVEAALLVETGSWRRFHRLVVVRCSRETQLRRLLDRGLGPEEARARIDAQAPVDARLAVADHVIDTEGPLESTRLHARETWDALLREFRRRFAHA